MNFVMTILYLVGLVWIGDYFTRICNQFNNLETKKVLTRFMAFCAMCFVFSYTLDNWRIISDKGIYWFLENFEFRFAEWFKGTVWPFGFAVIYAIVTSIKFSSIKNFRKTRHWVKKTVLIEVLEKNEEGKQEVVWSNWDNIWVLK